MTENFFEMSEILEAVKLRLGFDDSGEFADALLKLLMDHNSQG